MRKSDKDMRKKEKEKKGDILAIDERKKEGKKGMREKAAHAHVSETYTYEYLQVSFHEVR